MKISINYDFFDMLTQAKTGVSLQRVSKNTMMFTGANVVMAGVILASLGQNPLYSLATIPGFASVHIFGQTFPYILFNKNCIENAKTELINLSISLNSIGIHTNYDLLFDAYKYDTEYNLNYDEQKPRLEQFKYIMIPVQEDGIQKEMSIVQEHIIGAKDYIISSGSPKKVLKPVLKRV